MLGTELFRLQGFEQILAAGTQTPGTLEDGVDGFIAQQGLDHGSCGLPMQVGEQHIQTDPGIGQHLVQPVLLRGQHPAELLALSCDQAQMADLGRRNERGPHQARPRQRGQPLGIGDVRLAPGHVLDVTGIDHPRRNAHVLQCRIGTLPVNPRALHDHDVRGQPVDPRCQCPAIPLEATKLPLLHRHTAIGLLDQGAGRDLVLVHIQTDDPPVNRGDVHADLLRLTH